MKTLFSLFLSIFAVLGSERGTLDLTSFQPALKTIYDDKKINELTYQDNPWLALVPKMEKFFGENYKRPIVIANPQARSATFATASSQVAGASTKSKAFLLTRAKDYSLFQIDNETLKASESDAGAFLRAATVEIDGAMRSITRSLAIAMFGSGSGSIGQVANSSFATPDLTLTNPDDVTNFEVGMVLQVSATDGAGAGVRAGTLTVNAINRSSGVVTMSGNLSAGIAAIAQNDFIVQQGDYDLKLKGLKAWVPYGGPSASAFFGVDRTADSSRLGGQYQDGTAKPIEEALIDLAVRISREGGRPDHCFMNHADYANLEKALGSKVQYVNVDSGMPNIGFRGLLIQGPKGPIKVVPDQNCPSKFAYMLQLDTWELASLGKAPQLFDTDGLEMLRKDDGVSGQIYYYAQLSCNAPGWNGVVKLRA